MDSMATAQEMLQAERDLALERVAALEREFAGLAEAASSAGTDDEHDPEGATLAFERQHAAALLQAAREQVTAIDAALQRLAGGRHGGCGRGGGARGGGRAGAPPLAGLLTVSDVDADAVHLDSCAVFRSRPSRTTCGRGRAAGQIRDGG